MPVMPSFTGFAPKPDIAGAMQRRQALQQQAAQAIMQFQAQQQQLQQQRELAQMEAQMKERLFQRDTMVAQQRLAIDREYRDQDLNMKRAALQQDAAKTAAQMQLQTGLVQELEQIDLSQLTPEQKHQARSNSLLKWSAKGASVPNAGSILSTSKPAAAAKDIQPKAMRVDVGGSELDVVYNPQTGAFTKVDKDKGNQVSETTRRQVLIEDVRSLNREKSRLVASQDEYEPGSAEHTRFNQRVKEIERQLAEVKGQLLGPASPANTSNDPLGLFK